MRRRVLVPVLLGVALKGWAGPVPYEHRYYDGGYQVFVEAGNLPRARQVVENALYWRPDDPLWIERLGRVAGWQGDLEISLAAWLKLAESRDDEEAWRRVLVLSPLTYHDELTLRARHRLLARNPSDPSLIEQVADEYERLGRPEDGLAFLDQWRRRYPSRSVFRALQRLAENTGQDLRAARYYRAYMARYGVEPEAAMRAADLTWLRGDRDQAYRNLQHDAGALEYHAGITRRLAVMAGELGDLDAALAHYQRLDEGGGAEVKDYYRYARLARYHGPALFARVLDRLWRASGDPGVALSRLSLLRELGDERALTEFFQGLDDAQRRTFMERPDFLRAYADYRLSRGDLAGAERLLRQALALAPGDTDTRLAWLWFLIATGNDEQLVPVMARWEPVHRDETVYREALAAANLALDRPEPALRYQRALLRDAPGDWRRRWAYAQTLLAAGRERQAWPVMRSLWRDPPAETEIPPQWRSAYQEMRSVLVTRFEGGDQQLRFQRRAWAETSEAERADRAEWLAQWALAIDASELARRWYRQQHHWRGSLPAGSALALANLESDQDGIRSLRADRAGALTAGERLEADNVLDRKRLAASELAEQQRWAPEQADHHPQQESLLLPASRHVEVNLERRRLGPLALDDERLGLTRPMGDRWRWGWEASWRRFSSEDEALLRVDETARRLELMAGRQGRRLDVLLKAGWETRFDRDNTDLSLVLNDDPVARWGWRFEYQWRAPADESSELLLAGRRSGPTLNLEWRPGSHWSNGLSMGHYQYQDLDGGSLGQGWRASAQSSWRPWRSRWSPGVRVRHTRAGFSGQRPLALEADLTRPGAESSAAVPESYHETELALLLGSPDPHVRPHRLQAWAELGVTDNSVSGVGFNGRLGAEGPLLGRDAWRLYTERGLNTGGADEDGYRIGLQYEFYY
ncbi:tetratricopeptide repeat protein [Alloalcanivorax marinus]|uniref:tetratricopeptide repeat protein n=1 Tax=Alloalcanivorax marinus TaxID=1177169 RepID=UPI001957C30A|nr:tetratricopeptide repeat protein [Alloalcanivorax marinus]